MKALGHLVEGVYLAVLLVAPWPFGSAADAPRYAVTAVLLLAFSAWLVARPASAREWSLRGAALLLPGLAVLQILAGRTVAVAWTAEAALSLLAVLTATVFWAERARAGDAALRLGLAVVAIGVAEAVFGAVQWSRGSTTVLGASGPHVTSPFGSYVNHNHFAGLMEMTAFVAFGAAVGLSARHAGPPAGGMALAGAGLAMVTAHLASRSRGGLVALGGGIAAACLLASAQGGRPARRRAAAAGVALLVVLTVAVAAVPGSTRAHLATLLRPRHEASALYRLDVARWSLDLALERPLLGWGLGAFADALPPAKRGHGDVRTTHAESDVVQLLAEGGIVGLAAAAFGLACVGRRLAKRLREGHDPVRRGLLFGAAAGVSAVGVHSLVDFNLHVPANAVVFASLLGLLAAPRGSADPALPRPALAAAAALAVGALGLAAAWRTVAAVGVEVAAGSREPNHRLHAYAALARRHPYLAEAHQGRGHAWAILGGPDTPLGRVRLGRATADFRRAVAWRPLWGQAWFDLAAVEARLGNREQARAALDRARAADPTNLQFGPAAADLRGTLDGPRAALVAYRSLAALNPGVACAQLAMRAARWGAAPDLCTAPLLR